MTQQNIQYILTKQRTSQSMKMKGALASYERLNRFVLKHGHDVKHDPAELNCFVWVTDKEAIMSAETLEKQLFADFGEQPKKSKGFSLFGRKRVYNENFQWRLDGDVERHLRYVDELGALPDLEPRPPLNIMVAIDFWLKGADKLEDMRSNAIA